MSNLSKCSQNENTHAQPPTAVQRYVILANPPPKGIKVRYIIANPGSYAYFSPLRLAGNSADCASTFNNWKFGLEKYPHTYNADLLSTPGARNSTITRYFEREVRYLYGTADLGAPDQDCEAKAQGAGHLERGKLWWKYISENFAGPWINTTQQVAFVKGVGHDATNMFKSAEGCKAMFG